jgi:hypothetical protein
MRYKTLYNQINSYKHKLLGDKTPRQVVYWARRMIDNPRAKITLMRDPTNTCWSGLTIGGHFDPEEDKDVEVYIMFGSNCDSVFFGLAELDVFVNELFTTYVHEKRHKYQCRQRGNVYGPIYRHFKKIDDECLKKDLNYYGDPDELDAYALESAIEDRLHKTGFIQAKYKELFAERDSRVYNKFLKRKYKFENRITL